MIRFLARSGGHFEVPFPVRCRTSKHSFGDERCLGNARSGDGIAIRVENNPRDGFDNLNFNDLDSFDLAITPGVRVVTTRIVKISRAKFFIFPKYTRALCRPPPPPPTPIEN